MQMFLSNTIVVIAINSIRKKYKFDTKSFSPNNRSTIVGKTNLFFWGEIVDFQEHGSCKRGGKYFILQKKSWGLTV